MNDSTILRAILLSELLDYLKPIVAVLAALLLFYGGLHVLRKRIEVKSEPIVYEPIPVLIRCEYPDDPEFWQWYDALLAQGDFTYAEARAWYAMREHKDVAQMTGETMTAGQDEQT